MVVNSAAGHSTEAVFARGLQKHVHDLMQPSAAIYWADMLTTTAVGYGGLFFYLTATAGWIQVVAFLVAGFALYRALMFTHELTHLPKQGFLWFRATWNLLIGIPFLTPSFLYAEHRSHHVNHSYGTKGDAEYVPIGRGPANLLLIFVAQGLLMPVLAVLRFGVVAPISVLHPKIREFVWQRASGLTQNNTHFRRPWPRGRQWLFWGLQEFGCFLVCASLIYGAIRGVLPWTVLVKLYCLFAFVTTVSYLRALASHLYFNAGESMTYMEQMFDSTTIPGRPLLTELWAPLGQRYHALHHLFPSIPYHSLGIAHRRLMAELPADSPYRATIRSSLARALRDVWRQADRTDRARIDISKSA